MNREAVGRRYDAALMQRARERSWAVLHDIRQRMQPGMGEDDARDFASARAQAMGWRFNHAIKGHRLGDYPHSVHKGGDLGALEGAPSPGLWVLEIQIAHPTEPYGAFFEDLLVSPGAD